MNNISDSKSQNPQQKIASKQTTIMAGYSGPIPAPEALARYEQLTPGLADRIVKMAENEGNHRRSLEVSGQKAQIEHIERRDYEARRGQIFAFMISIITLISGAWIIKNGHDVPGTFVSLSGLGGIVTAFIYGRKS